MKYIVSFLVYISICSSANATQTICFQTVISKSVLPPFFPADKATSWPRLYFDSTKSLLAFNRPITARVPDGDKMDFAVIRTGDNQGRIAKWISGKWIATSNEYGYVLRKADLKKTKIICGYTCYFITFWDTENRALSNGWVTRNLPKHAGIKWINGLQGALLGYENGKEVTYAKNFGKHQAC